MYEEDKREVRDCFTQDTIGRKYSTKIVSPPKPSFKPPYKAETVSANLNTPMDKKKFSKLSLATQKEYVLKLRDEYGAQQTEIADMLGRGRASFSTYCKNTLGISFKRQKKKRTQEQEAKWQKFLRGEAIVEPKPEQPVVEETDSETKPEACFDQKPLATVMKAGAMCKKAHFEFEGDVNMVYLASLIGSITANETDCKITVTIERM